MNTYVLMPDYEYEGYGSPIHIWNYLPSSEELYQALLSHYTYPQYLHISEDNMNRIKKECMTYANLILSGNCTRFILEIVESTIKTDSDANEKT